MVNTDTGTHRLIQRLTEARSKRNLANQLGDAFLIFLRGNSHRRPAHSPAQPPSTARNAQCRPSLSSADSCTASPEPGWWVSRNAAEWDAQNAPPGHSHDRSAPSSPPGSESYRPGSRSHQQELRLQGSSEATPSRAAGRSKWNSSMITWQRSRIRLAQGNIRENLRGAADNRLRVDGGVADNHAHVLGTKMIRSKNYSDTSALMGGVSRNS